MNIGTVLIQCVWMPAVIEKYVAAGTRFGIVADEGSDEICSLTQANRRDTDGGILHHLRSGDGRHACRDSLSEGAAG